MALGEKFFDHVPRYNRPIYRNIRKHKIIDKGLQCTALTFVILLSIELISLAIDFDICLSLLLKLLLCIHFKD